MGEHPLVETRNLAKRYGQTLALRDVSLTVEGGTILLLLGPNGAGKTTLLRLLATAARPTGGEGTVAGFDLVKDASAVRRHVALVTHASMLYEDLTARENLRFTAAMLGRPGADLDAVLARIGLSRWADVAVRNYSNGMKRRVSLARAMLAEPRVLLLDEPYVGLDAGGVEVADGFALEVRQRGGAVILATHELERGFRVADRAIALEAGRIIGEDRTSAGRELVGLYARGGR